MEDPGQQPTVTPIAQQFNLKWTNHTNNIVQVLAENFLKDSLTDVTLSCDGQFIRAHKMILSACSLYFQEAFEVYRAEHPLIIMNGISFTVLKQVVEFMYRGEIKVNDSDLECLLMLAENLQVKGLCSVRVKAPENGEGSQQTDENPPVDEEAPQDSQRSAKKRKKLASETDQNSNATSTVSVKSDKTAANSIPSLGEMLKEEREKDIRLGIKKTATQSRRNSDELSLATAVLPVAMEDYIADDSGKIYDKLNKIPRPPNAFMIFANEWRKKLAVEHPGESNKDISIRLGNMWKSLSENTKNSYYTAAKKADQQHKAKYPGYYYSPKEARARKAVKSPSPASYHKKVKGFDNSKILKLIPLDEHGKQIQEDDEIQVIDESENSKEADVATTSRNSGTGKSPSNNIDIVATNSNETPTDLSFSAD